MSGQRLNWLVVVLGLVFVVNPLYWDVLLSIGVPPLLDWFGATGLIPAGSYYLAIGGMYLLAGGLTWWYGDENNGDVRQVGRGVGVSLLVVWAGLVVFWWTTDVELRVGLVAFVVGTGPVLIGFFIDATTDRATTRVLWGVVVVLLLPFVSWGMMKSIAHGGTTLGGYVFFLSAVLLIHLDALWAYPLYRLGRTLK